MPISAKPYAAKKFAEVNGRRMAYIDEGAGRRRSCSSTATPRRPICGATSCRTAPGSAGSSPAT